LHDAGVTTRDAVVLEPYPRVGRAADDRLGLLDPEHLSEAPARQHDEVRPIAPISYLDGGQIAYRGAIFVALVVGRILGHSLRLAEILSLIVDESGPRGQGVSLLGTDRARGKRQAPRLHFPPPISTAFDLVFPLPSLLWPSGSVG